MRGVGRWQPIRRLAGGSGDPVYLVDGGVAALPSGEFVHGDLTTRNLLVAMLTFLSDAVARANLLLSPAQ